MMRAGSKPSMPQGIGRCGAASRHARFAERIARRYTLHPLQRHARLSMTFAQRWMLQTFMQRHWHRYALTIAPRIDMRLSVVHPVSTAGEVRRQAPGTFSNLRQTSSVGPVVAGRVKPVLSIHRPVPRIFRRFGPARLGHSTDEAVPGGLSTQKSRLAPIEHQARFSAPPALDVDRLTEQVIRGIDRRIIAQRERLGRF
ncbi:MAG: hypothetical protein ACREUD_03040 [Gammaproteobacteria bacterium]